MQALTDMCQTLVTKMCKKAYTHGSAHKDQHSPDIQAQAHHAVASFPHAS